MSFAEVMDELSVLLRLVMVLENSLKILRRSGRDGDDQSYATAGVQIFDRQALQVFGSQNRKISPN